MSAIDRRIMKSAESIRFHQRERLRNTGGGQLVSAGVATFKAGFVTYGAGVELDAHESIKNQIPLNQVMFLRRHIPPRNKVLEVRKKQKADICMAKHMEEVQNRTSSHKITKGKKLMNIEIRGKSLTKK